MESVCAPNSKRCGKPGVTQLLIVWLPFGGMCGITLYIILCYHINLSFVLYPVGPQEERAAQVRNLSTLSALVAGFAMASFLEFNFDVSGINEGLMLAYGITTALVVCPWVATYNVCFWCSTGCLCINEGHLLTHGITAAPPVCQ
jgi:cytochrome bd-type quinol oxidase subunit 2